MNTLRWWLAVAVVMGCHESGEDAVLMPSAKDRPNQEGWLSTVTISTNGVTDSHIRYTHMMRWESRQTTTFNEGLQVDFYEDGRHTAVLTADSGDIRGNNNLTAIGRVVIVSDSGLSMRTEKVYWDNQKKRVFADGFVTLTSNEDTLNGYAFESNKDLTSWKMKNAFGQSARDLDLRTGTMRTSKRPSTQDRQLEREVEDVLKEDRR